MKKWIWLALLGCTSVQADMLDALKAYEEKNYTAAQQQFAELLPLGNELAAFNLGAMAYQAEGQEKDLTKALAYFMLAAELQHEQSKALINQLLTKATEQQLDDATVLFNQLTQQVIVSPTDLAQRADKPNIKPIKRVEPKYPIEAARKLLFGYVALRFLIDETGKVTAVDAMDAFPENTFEKESVKAVKKWRYEATGRKHVQRVRLDFSISGDIKITEVDKLVDELNLWDYAVAGSPEHQLALGTLLSLAQVQGGNFLEFDPALPLLSEPDYSIFQKAAQLKPEFDSFWGHAKVMVAENGVITQQISAEFAPENELETLVGQRFSGNVIAGKYIIFRQNRNYMRDYAITPVLEVSNAMSGMFWWEQAAKNGNVEAQRIMAAYDKQWEDYLLSKDDAEVMAWAGTRMILDGQREQGMALLEQAIAKNYQPAAEMKKQFM